MATPNAPNPQSQHHPSKPLTLLLGLSGPSSSGKTTLARLLLTLFSLPTSTSSPNNPSLSLFILHQDDFYHTDALIPVITTPANAASGLPSRDLQDWDCVESLDLDLMGRTLEFVKREGRLPVRSSTTDNEKDGDGANWGESKEDQNSVGPVDLPAGMVDELRGEVEGWWVSLLSNNTNKTSSSPPSEIRLCILDGFLLYPDPTSPADSDLAKLRTSVTEHLNLKLLLLASRTQTITRRGRRSGYVTLEGFWEDPEGYVEDVVWPNYVRDLSWLMKHNKEGSKRLREEGEHEGPSMVDVDEEVARSEEIMVAPGKGEIGLGEMLSWAVAEVRALVEGVVVGGR